MVNGEKIRQLMTEKGIQNKEMAMKAGVSESMMTFIVQGLREPNVSVLVRISGVLGCTVDELIVRREA